jgi:hypothetical protein
LDNRCEMYKHNHGEDAEVQIRERFGRALLVTCQATEAVRSIEAGLDHPAATRWHEAFRRVGQFDYQRLNAVLAFGLCRRVARVASVGNCKFLRLTARVSYLGRKLGRMRTLLLTGLRNEHCGLQAKRVDSHMNLDASLALTLHVYRFRT